MSSDDFINDIQQIKSDIQDTFYALIELLDMHEDEEIKYIIDERVFGVLFNCYSVMIEQIDTFGFSLKSLNITQEGLDRIQDFIKAYNLVLN
jgi:hypothetical protein